MAAVSEMVCATVTELASGAAIDDTTALLVATVLSRDIFVVVFGFGIADGKEAEVVADSSPERVVAEMDAAILYLPAVGGHSLFPSQPFHQDFHRNDF